MRVHVHRTSTVEIERQLTRIADLLEGLLGATSGNPMPLDQTADEQQKIRVEYTNERDEVVAYHVDRLKRR